MPPRYHFSVCKGPDCRVGGSDGLYQAARAIARTLAIATEVCELSRGGCYGLCHLGPNVVVREASQVPADPMRRGDYQLLHVSGEVHYWKMDADKCRKVLEEHVRGGKPVEALVCPPSERPDKR